MVTYRFINSFSTQEDRTNFVQYMSIVYLLGYSYKLYVLAFTTQYPLLEIR